MRLAHQARLAMVNIVEGKHEVLACSWTGQKSALNSI